MENKIIEYKTKGWGYMEIAKYLNLSRDYVMTVCHNYGIGIHQKKIMKTETNKNQKSLFT